MFLEPKLAGATRISIAHAGSMVKNDTEARTHECLCKFQGTVPGGSVKRSLVMVLPIRHR